MRLPRCSWLARMRRRWWIRLRSSVHQPLGRRGENLAAKYLQRLGCRIVARGIRMNRGELDLVAVLERTIIFVEVKTRRVQYPDESLAEAVTPEKERRITRAAYAFLKRHRLLGYPVRFDIITVHWPRRSKPQLRHYPHAFEAAGEGNSLY